MKCLDWKYESLRWKDSEFQ